ncbi:MAG: hypothetical protein IPI66_15875 [Chitinophagaceae bacterium]|nr:hypothetical protein [Chitinophagaceae bacterium]
MKEEEKYNLILADDHILLRDALATLISGFDHFNVLATASNGRELWIVSPKVAGPSWPSWT